MNNIELNGETNKTPILNATKPVKKRLFMSRAKRQELEAEAAMEKQIYAERAEIHSRHLSPEERFNKAKIRLQREKVLAKTAPLHLDKLSTDELKHMYEIGSVIIAGEENYNPEMVDRDFFKKIKEIYQERVKNITL